MKHRQPCRIHHVCSCISGQLDLAEQVLKRINGEFGGLHVSFNGMGQTTIREYLKLEEVIEKIHRE